MIKLIVTDIDGTLVNDGKKIGPKTVQAIKKARSKGILTVLCTGRPLSGVKDYLEELGLDSDQDYVITFNGAACQKVKSGQALFEYVLENDKVEKLLEFSQKAGVKSQTITLDNQIYTPNEDVSSYTVMDSFYTHMPLHIRSKVWPKDLAVAKFMWADQKENIDRALKEVQASFPSNLYTVRSEDWFFEFQNQDATKGKAVLKLAQTLGIKPHEVMTVGDQMNDLTMFAPEFFAVAMGNAVAEIKAASKAQTLSNNEDGLGVAIEKYVLS